MVTRQAKPRDEMIRFVLSPENVVTPDLKEKLPGRGVWVTAQQNEIKVAATKGHFARGFEQKVTVPQELDIMIANLLKEAALGRLKLANKAGQMIMGFTKLMAALEKGSIITLIHAIEGSADEARKLDHRLRTNSEQNEEFGHSVSKKTYNCFKTEELSLAFGAANVIHAGLKTGGAGLAAMNAMEKFVNYQA